MNINLHIVILFIINIEIHLTKEAVPKTVNNAHRLFTNYFISITYLEVVRTMHATPVERDLVEGQIRAGRRVPIGL